MAATESEIRDAMRINRDVAIAIDLRNQTFRIGK
jgi:hypothetical protein